MNLVLLLLALLLTPLIAAQCLDNWTPPQCAEILALESTSCTTYHIFIARGTDELLPGRQGELTRRVCAKLASTSTANDTVTCSYENIDYSAKSRFVTKQTWCQSATEGARAGQKQMGVYAGRCRESRLVLVGFSQGASVALDVVGGGGGGTFECVQEDTPALKRDTVPGDRLAAIAVFGAVRRSANQTYSVKGGAGFNGKSTRSSVQLAGLEPYADILRDYCNYGDFICAVGSQPEHIDNHLNYFDLYNEEAANWIVGTVLGRTDWEKKGVWKSLAGAMRLERGYDAWSVGVVAAVCVGCVMFTASDFFGS